MRKNTCKSGLNQFIFASCHSSRSPFLDALMISKTRNSKKKPFFPYLTQQTYRCLTYPCASPLTPAQHFQRARCYMHARVPSAPFQMTEPFFLHNGKVTAEQLGSS